MLLLLFLWCLLHWCLCYIPPFLHHRLFISSVRIPANGSFQFDGLGLLFFFCCFFVVVVLFFVSSLQFPPFSCIVYTVHLSIYHWRTAVDLTGQICADSVGSRIISGVGGQMDFMRVCVVSLLLMAFCPSFFFSVLPLISCFG